MEIASLFSTVERIITIEYVLSNPSQKFSVRKLARTLKLSPSHISKILKQLSKMKIIENNVVNLKNPITRILKIFFNIEKLEEISLIKFSKKTIPKLLGIGIYGSWADGTNYEDSDLDIWIKSSEPIKEKNTAKLNSYLIRKLGREVTLLSLWPEKIEILRKKDEVFYHSLTFGSIVLFGEKTE